MLVREAQAIAGTLSNTSKMPGFSTSTPANACNVGSKLAKIEGSICHGCYAKKGAYAWSNTQASLEKRLQSLTDPRWVEAMVVQIRSKLKYKPLEDQVFRWHDSGDIQSWDHLTNIIAVCEALPHVSFWLPTREASIYRRAMRDGVVPSNLAMRYSSSRFGQGPIAWAPLTSTSGSEQGYLCPVNREEGRKECGSCRACWDTTIGNIDYAQH